MRTQHIVRAGIVGGGETRAAHVAAMRRIPGVQIVGVFDVDPIGAKRASVELRIPVMASLTQLRDAGASVIHLLASANRDPDIAAAALDLGCHLFIETPVATDVSVCRAITNVAAARRLHVCVGQSLLFDPYVHRAMLKIRSGKLGRIVSVDFLRNATPRPYTGGPLPAFCRSAGHTFRTLGVDALYLCEALIGPIEHVQADWIHLGGAANLAFDEWRAQIRCRDGIGQCQISYNARTLRDRLIVQGTRGSLDISLPRGSDRGMSNLLARFYESLNAGKPAPVTMDDAKRVVQWTERIARLAEQDHRRRVSIHRLSDRVPYLVTGATGALGRAIVTRLRDEGKRVRIFVRRPPESTVHGIEAAIGDLGDPEAVSRAVRGVGVVIHAGAARHDSDEWGNVQCATIAGTQNIVHACLDHNVEKLIHISSLHVLDLRRADGGAALTESSRLEERPALRDVHTRGKIEAERIVALAAAHHRLPAVVLRLGHLFGDGLPLITSSIARHWRGQTIVLGDGRRRVPLLHIDDAVEAILVAANGRLRHGEIIHLVDDVSPMQTEVIAAALGKRSPIVHIPRWIVIIAASLVTAGLELLGRRARVSTHQLRADLSRCTFVGDQRDLLDGWRPTLGLNGAMLRHVMHSRGRLTRVIPAGELLIDASAPPLGTTSDPRA